MSKIVAPKFITFTGIDDRTDLAEANRLASIYPIEWGVLFSATNQDSKFPSTQGVKEILQIKGQKSAHLCGSIARRANEFGDCIFAPLDEFDRCQVNGKISRASNIHKLQNAHNLDVICQLREDKFWKSAYQLLFDCSGGRGQIPKRVPPHPKDGRMVGYAGGMGPDTIDQYLELINIQSKFHEYWIDMEGRVRTNGWFDLKKVADVCYKVYSTGKYYRCDNT